MATPDPKTSYPKPYFPNEKTIVTAAQSCGLFSLDNRLFHQRMVLHQRPRRPQARIGRRVGLAAERLLRSRRQRTLLRRVACRRQAIAFARRRPESPTAGLCPLGQSTHSHPRLSLGARPTALARPAVHTDSPLSAHHGAGTRHPAYHDREWRRVYP